MLQSAGALEASLKDRALNEVMKARIKNALDYEEA